MSDDLPALVVPPGQSSPPHHMRCPACGCDVFKVPVPSKTLTCIHCNAQLLVRPERCCVSANYARIEQNGRGPLDHEIACGRHDHVASASTPTASAETLDRGRLLFAPLDQGGFDVFFDGAPVGSVYVHHDCMWSAEFANRPLLLAENGGMALFRTRDEAAARLVPHLSASELGSAAVSPQSVDDLVGQLAAKFGTVEVRAAVERVVDRYVQGGG